MLLIHVRCQHACSPSPCWPRPLRLAFTFSFPSIPRECALASLVSLFPERLLVSRPHRQSSPVSFHPWWAGLLGTVQGLPAPTVSEQATPSLLLAIRLLSGRRGLDIVLQVGLWKLICHRGLFVQVYLLFRGNLVVISAADSWFGYFIHHSSFCHFPQLLLHRLPLSLWVIPFKPYTHSHTHTRTHTHTTSGHTRSLSSVRNLVSCRSRFHCHKYVSLIVMFCSDSHDL